MTNPAFTATTGARRDVDGSPGRCRQQFDLDQENLKVALAICIGVALNMM